MDITKMTKKEFRALPLMGWGKDIGEFDSLVILPTKRIHDSGWRNMDFVACKENEPICRLSGCSDVLHFDGVGGLGKNWTTALFKNDVLPKVWRIDCLRESGLLRLWSYNKLKAGQALSDFEVFSITESN